MEASSIGKGLVFENNMAVKIFVPEGMKGSGYTRYYLVRNTAICTHRIIFRVL
jgi:hypothetical protein